MNPTFIVWRKELRDLLRDRRVRNNAFVMPMILVIVILALFGLITRVGEKQNQKVHVVGGDNAFVAAMRQAKFQVMTLASVEEGQKLVREGKARLVLSFPPDFDRRLQAGEQSKIAAYFDPQQETGAIALRVTQDVVDKFNQVIEARVLASKGLTKSSVEPLQFDERKVIVGTSDTSEILIGFLPYLIVVYAFFGGMATASDLVAGEKEKLTLETLLIAPVGRSQIAMGKFLSLATICLMGSLSALLGFVIAGLSGLDIFSKLFPKGVGISLGQVGVIVLVLIPTVAFFAGMLLAISTLAKNSREAQSHLAIVSIVVMMPAMFSQFIGLTDLASSWWIRLIPVLNTSLAVREALQGKVDVPGILMTIAVGAVLGAIGVRLAVHLFKREQVLNRI